MWVHVWIKDVFEKFRGKARGLKLEGFRKYQKIYLICIKDYQSRKAI